MTKPGKIYCFVDLNNRRTGKHATKPRALGLLGHNDLFPLINKLRPRLQLIALTDRWMDRQMVLNVQLLLQGGGGQYRTLCTTCTVMCAKKIVVNFRAIEKARKGIILHWKSSNTHWKTKQGVKISFYISPYALLVAVQTRKWEPEWPEAVSSSLLIPSPQAMHWCSFFSLMMRLKEMKTIVEMDQGLRRWPDFGCQHDKSATHPDLFCVYLTRAKPQSKFSMFDI